MRNLKKYLAIAVAVAMLLTLMAPAMAASTGTYSAEAQKLNDLGLYNGVSTTSFDPDLGSTLDRQTAAVFLARLAGLEQEAKDMDLAEAKNTLKAKFKDASSIADWAAKHVALYADSGVIAGFPDGTFQPKALVTGKQFCTLMLKQLGYSDFTFEQAAEKYTTVAGLSADEKANFGTTGAIKKDVLIGISFKGLAAKVSGKENTLIDSLVKDGVVEKAKAEAAGFTTSGSATATTAPAEGTGAPAATSVASEVYGTVAVKAEFPAAKSVATGESLLTVATLTFKSATNVEVTGLKLNRSGLSKDTDIASVTVWDGTERLNVPGIFSNNVADITFNSPVKVEAGKDKVLAVKMNIAAAGTATAGDQIVISLNAATDVKSKATVEGTFPASSNTFTVASITLGTVTVTKSGDAPTAALDAGKNDVTLAKFDLQAGSTEDVTVNTLTLTQNGTIADSDIKNIRLYNGATLLGTVESLSARKATFTFSQVITAGAKVYLTVKADVVGGAGRTVQLDMNNVNDVQAVGKTYGTVIVPTATATSNALSINNGSLIIGKDITSSPAGNISTVVDDQEFTTIKVEALGEPIQLRTMVVSASTTNAGLGHAAVISDLTDLKLWYNNATIASVATPFTGNVNNKEVTLSTPVTVYPGTPVLIKMTADIAAGITAEADDTYALGVSGSPAVTSSMTGVGLVSGKDINGSNALAAASISGNIKTVGNLQFEPVVINRANDYAFTSESNKKFAEFDLKHNLTEAVNVSTINVTLVAAGAGVGGANTQTAAQNLTNLKIKDSQGNVITNVITSAATTNSFSLNNPITINANETVRVALYGDVLSTAFATDGYKFDVATTSVVRTVKSGTSVTVQAATGTPKSTISAGGATLTATASTVANLEDTNTMRGAKALKLAQYTLTNTGAEDATLNKVRFAVTYAGTMSSAYLANVKLVDGANNVLANVSSLDADTYVTLSSKLSVGSISPNNKAEIALVADVATDAPLKGTIAVSLGDGNGLTNDLDYQGKYTGMLTQPKNISVDSDIADGTSVVYTVNPGAVTIEAKTVATTVPKIVDSNGAGQQANNAAGVEVARFSVKNACGEAIVLKGIQLDDLASATGFTSTNLTGLTAATITVTDLTDGEVVTFTSDTWTGNQVTFAVTSTVRISANSSKDFSVRIATNATEVNNGSTSNIRVLKGATTYDLADGTTTGLKVDNSKTLDNVIMNP